MKARSKTWVVGVVIGVAVLVVALVISAPGSSKTHLDPASTDPGGTKALVDLVNESGGQVTITSATPGPSSAVALLLVDTTSEAMTSDLEQWVRRGGVLVVPDPRSSFVPRGRPAPTVFGLGAATLPRGDCRIGALAGVEHVAPGDGSVLFEVPDGASGCIDRGSGAFVVDQPLDQGHIVSVGGAAALTNELLGTEDNAVLAVSLLAPRPGTSVSVLWGMTAGGSRRTLASLVSTGVRLGLWELVIAFIVYALWRGRRLGKPVAEVQPVQIGGSELVGAVGNLLQQSHDPDRAARLLRADLRRQLTERLGLGPGATPDVLAEVTVARTGVARDRVARAVTDLPVRSEAELLALAHDIDTIRTEVLHGIHS
jgi:hypothetical protein